MRRRTFLWACAAVFTMAGWRTAAAQDLAPPAEMPIDAVAAAPVDAPLVDGAPVDGAPVDGAPADGACADGSCSGGFGPNAGCLGPLVCLPRDTMNPYLFYNYYVGGNCGSIPAAMYPSPMPTPPVVGHTYFTYQPFYPHEFMYAHRRTYHHHYDYNRGLTRTRVIWAW
jgi:hypothetical protein